LQNSAFGKFGGVAGRRGRSSGDHITHRQAKLTQVDRKGGLAIATAANSGFGNGQINAAEIVGTLPLTLAVTAIVTEKLNPIGPHRSLKSLDLRSELAC